RVTFVLLCIMVSLCACSPVGLSPVGLSNEGEDAILIMLQQDEHYSNNVVEYQEENFRTVLREKPEIVLCEGFGGGMIMFYYEIDLDHDGKNDMVYWYNWGSGVAGYAIKAMSGGEVLGQEIKWTYDNAALSYDEGKLLLLYRDLGDELIIGELFINKNDNAKTFGIDFAAGLSDDLKTKFTPQ
ncbi:MAG: hypothetical protein FWH57_08045, partial [Oscillospiraceae bacterium]|nr:hypothetical protein [Oscillospiraceae bacterium]